MSKLNKKELKKYVKAFADYVKPGFEQAGKYASDFVNDGQKVINKYRKRNKKSKLKQAMEAVLLVFKILAAVSALAASVVLLREIIARYVYKKGK